MISYTRPRYTRGLYGYKDLDLCKTHLQDPSRAFTYIDNEPCSEREIFLSRGYSGPLHEVLFIGIKKMRVSDFK